MSEIYKIINNELNMAYIGSTELSFHERYSGKWWVNHPNVLLTTHALEYGLRAFSVEILEKDPMNLLKAETDAIIKYKTLAPLGYNLKYPIQPDKEQLAKAQSTQIRHEFYKKMVPSGVPPRTAIKTYRKMLRMNQANFAEFTGVPIRTIQDFEQGRANPTLKTLEKMMRGSGLMVGFIERQEDDISPCFHNRV